MRRVFAVPKLGDSFEWVCEAVLVLQRRTTRHPVMEPVASAAALAAEAVVVERGSATGVLLAPEPQVSVADKAGLFADVRGLRAAAPDLPLLVVLEETSLGYARGSPRIAGAVRELARLGVDEIVVEPEEATPVAMARRLEKLVLTPFELEFLRAFPELPDPIWFVVRRLLEDREQGIRSDHAGLAASYGCEEDELVAAFAHHGLGSIDVWRDLITLYGAVTSATANGRDGFEAGGRREPPPTEVLEHSCRCLTDAGIDSFMVPEGVRRLLEILSCRRWVDVAAETADAAENRTVAPAFDRSPAAGEGAFTELVRGHRHAALEEASRVLRCRDQADDVVQDVLLRVWDMGPGKWPNLSRAYFVQAARNRARDLLRARPWECKLDGLNEFELRSRELGADLRLDAAVIVRSRTGWYHRLPPRQCLAVWLSGVREWRPREIQRLLGVTGSSFRNLRRRGQEALTELALDNES